MGAHQEYDQETGIAIVFCDQGGCEDFQEPCETTGQAFDTIEIHDSWHDVDELGEVPGGRGSGLVAYA